MKTIMTSIAACAAIAVAGQAAAIPNGQGANGHSFAPANDDFSGSGQLSWSIPGQPSVTCIVALTGQTKARGSLVITGLTYSDDGDGTCTDVSSPNVAIQYWNPTSTNFAHWGNAMFTLPPKGVKCKGNIGLSVKAADGGDTMVYIDSRIASPAGVCHVTGEIDVGNVVIAPTPPR